MCLRSLAEMALRLSFTFATSILRHMSMFAKTEPQARSVSYDRKTDRLIIELKNGATFMVPCNLIQGLRDAPPELIAEVNLRPRGAALHWETLDVDFSLAALIAGMFGSEAWMSSLAKEMGRKGGSATSEVKAASSRENGKRGGRPRKDKIA